MDPNSHTKHKIRVEKSNIFTVKTTNMCDELFLKLKLQIKIVNFKTYANF